MKVDYWVNNESHKEIVTKIQIANKLGFRLLACHYNMLNQKGLAFQFDKTLEFETGKVFRKNGFEYVVLEQDDFKELWVLPNEYVIEFTDMIVSQIGNCQNEIEVLHLIVKEM